MWHTSPLEEYQRKLEALMVVEVEDPMYWIEPVIQTVMTGSNYDCGEPAGPAIESLIRKYGNPIGCGLSRLCFASKYCVIKVPINDEGYCDNKCEYISYIQGYEAYNKILSLEVGLEQELRFAKCRLITIQGIEVLLMEKLDTQSDRHLLPDWADFIDCQQVGLDRKGQWKAYDYA